MQKKWIVFLLLVFLPLATVGAAAKKIGKITYVEGDVKIQKKEKLKAVKVSASVRMGQTFVTGEQSRLEVVYSNGTVLRIGENSVVALNGNEAGPRPEVKKGKIWANVMKITSGKGSFQVKTPVATAAVRGTVFRVDVADSSSSVALYEGKVDVGPADTSKIKDPEPVAAWGPPKEVPGPYEVSLETWVSLDPGNMINIRWDGSYKVDKLPDEATNEFVKWNQGRDKSVQR